MEHVFAKAIEYPVLAYPPGHSERFDYANRTIADEHDKPDKREFERYEWFISYLLKTSREILQHFYRDQYWRKTIRRNIRYHKSYLVQRKQMNEPNDYIELAGPQVNQLIDEVVSENAASRPRGEEEQTE